MVRRLTVKALMEALATMPPERQVCFDTEAARFDQHLVPVSTVFNEDDVELVILHSDIERMH